eukprot:jgi/Botrbrau1/23502/Bobra.106_1s0053.1
MLFTPSHADERLKGAGGKRKQSGNAIDPSLRKRARSVGTPEVAEDEDSGEVELMEGEEYQAEIPPLRPRPAAMTPSEAQWCSSLPVLQAGDLGTPRGTLGLVPICLVGTNKIPPTQYRVSNGPLLDPRLVHDLGLDRMGINCRRGWSVADENEFAKGITEQYVLENIQKIISNRSMCELAEYYYNVWKTRSTAAAVAYYNLPDSVRKPWKYGQEGEERKGRKRQNTGRRSGTQPPEGLQQQQGAAPQTGHSKQPLPLPGVPGLPRPGVQGTAPTGVPFRGTTSLQRPVMQGSAPPAVPAPRGTGVQRPGMQGPSPYAVVAVPGATGPPRPFMQGPAPSAVPTAGAAGLQRPLMQGSAPPGVPTPGAAGLQRPIMQGPTTPAVPMPGAAGVQRPVMQGSAPPVVPMPGAAGLQRPVMQGPAPPGVPMLGGAGLQQPQMQGSSPPGVPMPGVAGVQRPAMQGPGPPAMPAPVAAGLQRPVPQGLAQYGMPMHAPGGFQRPVMQGPAPPGASMLGAAGLQGPGPQGPAAAGAVAQLPGHSAALNMTLANYGVGYAPTGSGMVPMVGAQHPVPQAPGVFSAEWRPPVLPTRPFLGPTTVSGGQGSAGSALAGPPTQPNPAFPTAPASTHGLPSSAQQPSPGQQGPK